MAERQAALVGNKVTERRCTQHDAPSQDSGAAMTLDPRLVALALRGIVTGNKSVLAPGPGHSLVDRSLSIKIDPAVADGFILHSFAGDNPTVCRDHVRAALRLGRQAGFGKRPRRSPRLSAVPVDNASDRSEFALRLWQEACDPRGTVVTHYLASRSLTLPDDVAGDVVRFHPALKYNGGLIGGMVALFRDIRTNTPCGVQRTFLDHNGRKVDRRMLGRAKQAAIKIDADENVTMGLTIGEGFETCLAAWLAGFRPVWATGSVSGIAKFPVLPGVEALTILGESGDGGANDRASEVCVNRWIEVGQEVFVARPLIGDDLNDAWREAVE
jgi:hypothetical protein